MSKSVIVIWGAILLGCLVFALSPGPAHFLHHPGSWELREQLVFLTGVCSITLMVASMLIAARFPWISRLLNGLDKGYVVHKWTGIFAAISVAGHFLMEKAPAWLVAAGVIPNPGELTDGSRYTELEIALFQSGVLVAQPVGYAMIALVVIAIFKSIPYHWFRRSHRFFPVVFLVAAYHAATAPLKESWFGSPGGFLLLLILFPGVVVAILSLFKKTGASRRVKARISKMELHADNILDLGLTIENKPFDYLPGQYAFLQFSHSGEPHPFSFASSGEKGTMLRFAIKGLGDFTSQLPEQLRIGQTVQVEGPYGAFLFNDSCEQQVWIAGGIGVTPFMARLEYLASHGKRQPVYFFYATRRDKNASFPIAMEELCASIGVNFYHLNSSRGEYVTAALIKSKAGDLSNTSIWFCGPGGFAACIMRDLRSTAFNMRNFHYDSFHMR